MWRGAYTIPLAAKVPKSSSSVSRGHILEFPVGSNGVHTILVLEYTTKPWISFLYPEKGMKKFFRCHYLYNYYNVFGVMWCNEMRSDVMWRHGDNARHLSCENKDPLWKNIVIRTCKFYQDQHACNVKGEVQYWVRRRLINLIICEIKGIWLPDLMNCFILQEEMKLVWEKSTQKLRKYQETYIEPSKLRGSSQITTSQWNSDRICQRTSLALWLASEPRPAICPVS